jgi:quercetin dioxygenase-like cupin family protein
MAELRGAGDGARHVHRRHLETLYVLDGELSLTLGDRDLRAPAGTWVTVPPGVPHARAGSARFLELHTPGCGFGAYLRGDAGAFDQAPA